MFEFGSCILAAAGLSFLDAPEPKLLEIKRPQEVVPEPRSQISIAARTHWSESCARQHASLMGTRSLSAVQPGAAWYTARKPGNLRAELTGGQMRIGGTSMSQHGSWCDEPPMRKSSISKSARILHKCEWKPCAWSTRQICAQRRRQLAQRMEVLATTCSSSSLSLRRLATLALAVLL